MVSLQVLRGAVTSDMAPADLHVGPSDPMLLQVHANTGHQRQTVG